MVGRAETRQKECAAITRIHRQRLSIQN